MIETAHFRSKRAIERIAYACAHCAGSGEIPRSAWRKHRRHCERCPACRHDGKVTWVWHLRCPACKATQSLRLDALVSARRQLRCSTCRRRFLKSTLREYAEAILMAMLIAFGIRSFLVEPYKIPSPSMVPTLLVGDYIFVNKFHYGLRLPLTKWWPIRFHPVQRGDVVVFIYPVDESDDYIKRVIGLPGDHIRLVGHDVSVNGVLLQHEVMPPPPDINDRGAYAYYHETIGTARHVVRYSWHASHEEHEFTVPERGYFVMGDNRDNSQDSRFWGVVPPEYLKGRAICIWLSRDYDRGGIRWQRFGETIH